MNSTTHRTSFDVLAVVTGAPVRGKQKTTVQYEIFLSVGHCWRTIPADSPSYSGFVAHDSLSLCVLDRVRHCIHQFAVDPKDWTNSQIGIFGIRTAQTALM
ncbi:hypothetical protein PAMP_001108 [Pampus punctatissimus]